MKKISDFKFGLSLGFSLMLVPLAFMYAMIERHYFAIGGEIITIFLPAIVLIKRAKYIKSRKYNRKQEEN